MKGLETLAGSLAEVDRRIDNMTFLMRFQVEKRERILASMREVLGRSLVRATPLASGQWRTGAGDRCGICGGVLADDGGNPTMRALKDDDGRGHVAAAQDVAMLAMGVLLLPDGWSDLGDRSMHSACADEIGSQRKP